MSQALSYDVAGSPPQDLGKAVSSVQGISGAILLALAVLVALYFSFREFPTVTRAAATPQTEPPGTPPHT